jgi:epsilon-lactone hydrolase
MSTEDVLIKALYPPSLNGDPQTPEDWKAFGSRRAQRLLAALPVSKLAVSAEPSTIAGVKVFIVTPKVIPQANQNRLLAHLHAMAW